MNEWGFGGEIKSWWDAEFAAHPDWGIIRGEIERQPEGSRQRADLSIIADDRRTVLIVELRLPDHELANPWHLENLANASDKARRLGARWSATSDGERFLLIDGAKKGPLYSRVVRRPKLSQAATRSGLDTPALFSQVRTAWVELLHNIVPILRGVTPPPIPPDELFVDSLRALLAAPVAAIRDGISLRKDTHDSFREELIRWMVEEQGWTHSLEDFEGEIARVASVAAYVLTTRLMFYEALRRKQSTLQPLDLGSTNNPVVATRALDVLFEEARRLSQDYATVFTFDEICRYSLVSPLAIEGWRRVLDHLGQFKLDMINYDVLGRLFERFIDPLERHYWGQHYTHPDVVDMMLSLAIPDGKGTILDPASGGGTFVVRGYVRKQVLNPGCTHQERLTELAGCDMSAFAASLATISLASRELSFAYNYPQIHAGSFFQRDPGSPFLYLPSIDGGRQAIILQNLAAIVCNPPYVAMKHVGATREHEANAALIRDTGGKGVPRHLHGKANYHLYFWFHGAQFLRDDGRLVFITSGEWLDSDYGVQLQQWLLDNTKIEIIIDTLAETWFTEARVGTVVLSARLYRSTNGDPTAQEQRDANEVRFVTFRRSMREVFGCEPEETDAEHIAHVDALRERLLTLVGVSGEGDDFDHSVVTQRYLRQLGTR